MGHNFFLGKKKNIEYAFARFSYAEDIAYRKVESSFFHYMLMAIAKVGPSED
jgi:hypothetical protein